jgi:hypothetical protein
MVVLGIVVAGIGLLSAAWQIKVAGLGLCVRSTIVGICGLLIALGGGFLAARGEAPATALDGYAPTMAAAPSAPSLPMPGDQAHIMAILTESRDAFRAAPGHGDAAFAIRAARRDRLCKELPSRSVTDWRGVITRAALAGDGRRSLAVSTASGVTLSTGHSVATGAADDALIGAGSDLFHSTVDLAPGTRVVFSGMFYPDPEDCLRGMNTSQQDSMTQPDFLFRFTAIRKE